MIAIFYDLETTGLPRRGDDPMNQPGIIQIAGAYVDTELWEKDSDGILKTFDQMCNPELPHDRWEAGAIKMHGVQPQDVEGCPSFFTVGADFARFCVGAIFMSGFNIVGFDNKVLQWQLRRYGMEMNFPWPPRHVDIMDIAKRSGKYVGKRGPKAPKLVELYEELAGKKLEGAHNAAADTAATVFCGSKIARREFAR